MITLASTRMTSCHGSTWTAVEAPGVLFFRTKQVGFGAEFLCSESTPPKTPNTTNAIKTHTKRAKTSLKHCQNVLQASTDHEEHQISVLSFSPSHSGATSRRLAAPCARKARIALTAVRNRVREVTESARAHSNFVSKEVKKTYSFWLSMCWRVKLVFYLCFR